MPRAVSPRQVRLSFEWDITAKGLLGLQLEAMERVLVQRVEILCMLSPVPASRALGWALHKAHPPPSKVPLPPILRTLSPLGPPLASAHV